MNLAPCYFIFDVESIGLHGEGFAFGFTVIKTETGEELDSGISACRPDLARGTLDSRAWVAANLPAIESSVGSPRVLREVAWNCWRTWSGKGAVAIVDCGWPVEARFLSDCVADFAPGRDWKGPFPLHEAATLYIAAGMATFPPHVRLPEHLPEHNPLNDARHTARLLRMALERLGACKSPNNQPT